MCAVALHNAVDKGRLRQLAVLLDLSTITNVDLPDKQGLTLLMKCSIVPVGSCHLATILLQHGADKSIRDPEGNNALMHAVARGKLDLVKLLLSELNFDLNAGNSEGRCALHIAAALGNKDIVKELVENLKLMKMTLDPKDMEGFTPLLIACRHGKCDIACYLYQNGASKNIKDNKCFLNAAEWLATVFDIPRSVKIFSENAMLQHIDLNITRRQIPLYPTLATFFKANVHMKENQSVEVQQRVRQCMLNRRPQITCLLGQEAESAFKPVATKSMSNDKFDGVLPVKKHNETKKTFKMMDIVSAQLSPSYRPPAFKPPPPSPPQIPELIVSNQGEEDTKDAACKDLKEACSPNELERRESCISRRKSSTASSSVSSSSSLASRAKLTTRLMKKMRPKLSLTSGSDFSTGTISRKNTKEDL